MSIVFITIPGDTKMEFANILHQKTNGSVDLVIVQKPKKKTILQRIKRFWKNVSWKIFEETWYAILLRFNPKIQNTLGYFRESTPLGSSTANIPKMIEVESVNSEEVYEIIKKISPTVIMAWGCAMLEPRILNIPKHAINLHFGYCPYYRGALANQYAVYNGDFSKIGATIHYMNEKPDAGEIITVISADTGYKPKEMFCRLNDQAMAEYLRIGVELHSGKDLPKQKQDISKSRNFLLKSWTPKRRYELGKKIIEWEKRK